MCKHRIERGVKSPSVWREWIEIYGMFRCVKNWKSPSVWREWIEITYMEKDGKLASVSLRVEGVD